MPPLPSAAYERLRLYIAERMRMSHIDQPLMLMERICRRRPAPAQVVARRILGEDVTPIAYYTERVNRMVGFDPSPTDPLHLVLLMKDILRTLG